MRTTRSLSILTLTLFFFGAQANAQTTAGSTVASEQPQVTQPAQGGVNWRGVGIGAGTIAGNLVYVPAKLVYGILGGIAGGAGYALTGGNKQVADSIWRSSLGGDYVLTPDKITGQKPIYFSGPSEAAPSQKSTIEDNQSLNRTASMPPTSPPPGTGVTSTSHPVDYGAGPVDAAGGPRPDPYSGLNNPAGGYSGPSVSPMPTSKASPVPDTSIE
jgi:hypothetical protein